MTDESAPRQAGLRAALLPGLVIYAMLSAIILGNTSFYLAVPSFIAFAVAGALLQPLLGHYSKISGRRVRGGLEMFARDFFRTYLTGRGLTFAYVFNYLAVASFIGMALVVGIGGILTSLLNG